MSNAKFIVPMPFNEPILEYRKGSLEKSVIKTELKRQKTSAVEIRVKYGNDYGSGKDATDIYSPHNKKLRLASCQHASESDIDRAIKTALSTRKSWAGMPWYDRAAIFLKAAELLTTRYRPILNAATMLGQSKTVYQAEIDAACEVIDFFRYNAKFMERIYQQQPLSGKGMWNRMEARGLEGFVFAVTPFNFTAIAMNLPVAPALMGCVVVWKPAMSSILSSYWCLKLLEEAGLPEGVINFVPGNSKMIAAKVLEHPEFAGVHFTGSTQTFNYIWQTIGQNINRYHHYPRIVGETGGKDFIFAHPSADIKALKTALIRGSFEYQGQKCSAASRAYIPKSIWQRLKAELVEETSSLKMGDVEDFTNFMGAVIDAKAFEKIKSYIDHARSANDAHILVGGECDDSLGYFIRPTIIETTNPTYKSMVEEIFGPVLTVFVYEDKSLDKAVELCENSSPYALTGSLFAQDRRIISELSARFENAAGNFYINDKPTGAVVGQQPFGGGRASGTNDKAGSPLNLMRWASMRTIKETFVPPVDYRYPFMEEP